MRPRWLILETAHRLGRVALADDATVVGERQLDESRRHARDLVPAVKDLLAEQGWRPRDLTGVIVSRGPGSYTGLRVGLMSAKTFAYATGAALLAVDTFAALAHQAPDSATTVDVVADAQQEKLYVQRFGRAAAGAWQPQTPLAVQPLADWLAARPAGGCVLGPALERYAARLPADVPVAPAAAWLPQPTSLLAVGRERWQRGERDDPFAVEPLYLRPSSAEEKWTQLGK